MEWDEKIEVQQMATSLTNLALYPNCEENNKVWLESQRVDCQLNFPITTFTML